MLQPHKPLRFYHAFKTVWHKVEWILCLIGGFILLIITIHTCMDVLGRYLFNSPLPDTLEITKALMVGIVFLTVPYVASTKGHVRVELFTEHLPHRGQLYFAMLSYLVGLFVFSLAAWDSGAQAWTAFITKDFEQGIFQIPYWPSKMLVPLGCGMLSMRCLIDLVDTTLELGSKAIPDG
ncbi:MAG: TRAP transporter small permease [Thermodesulfobacteriota bacterium]